MLILNINKQEPKPTSDVNELKWIILAGDLFKEIPK